MAPPSAHTTALAARLDGVVALDLEVADTFELAPEIQEVTLRGDLAGFSPWPGQDLMVSVPPGDPGARWRRYTVRRLDAASSTLDVWVTLDTDGPGAAWARGAAVGDTVEAIGPRGKIKLDESAAAHLFVVDLSGAGAMCAMAEAIEAPALAVTMTFLPLELKGGFQMATTLAPDVATGVDLRNHVVQDDPAQRLGQTLGAVTQLIEQRPIAAYTFGELAFTRLVTAQLPDCGIDAERIASKAYWRNDRANESNGEPSRTEAADSE